MQSQKQQVGFSLLELLLVLAIIAIIILSGLQRYKQYTLDKDLASIRQNEALLMNALNTYYAKLASDPKTNPATHANTSINNNDLQQDNLWPKNLLSSNLVQNDYTVSVSEPISILPPLNLPSKTPYYTYNLQITVTFNPNAISEQNLTWFAKMLGASIIDDNKLQWQQMPSFTTKGIDNQLWIMNGGLATFKKALTSL
jgi:prepilin-type N-terminal cleavage/methylation domain-containing protein